MDNICPFLFSNITCTEVFDLSIRLHSTWPKNRCWTTEPCIQRRCQNSLFMRRNIFLGECARQPKPNVTSLSDFACIHPNAVTFPWNWNPLLCFFTRASQVWLFWSENHRGLTLDTLSQSNITEISSAQKTLPHHINSWVPFRNFDLHLNLTYIFLVTQAEEKVCFLEF